MWSFVTGFFHLTSCFQVSSMLMYWYFFACISISFPFLWAIFTCMNVSHFICPSVDGHLGCFPFWAIMNNAAVYIHVPVFM